MPKKEQKVKGYSWKSDKVTYTRKQTVAGYTRMVDEKPKKTAAKKAAEKKPTAPKKAKPRKKSGATRQVKLF